MAGAVLELIDGASPTPPTFLKDAAGASGERRATVETEMTDEAEKIEEVVSIAGVLRRGGSDRLAEERTESAAAARTAATS